MNHLSEFPAALTARDIGMIALIDAYSPGNVPTPAGKHLERQDRAVDINGLRFSWGISSVPMPDIDSLQVDKGQQVFIEGPSGSGKSTLLTGVVTSQTGCVNALDRSLNAMNGPDLSKLRTS